MHIPINRRGPDRLRTPQCSNCNTDAHVYGTLRVSRAVYFRCAKCGTIWSELKQQLDYVGH